MNFNIICWNCQRAGHPRFHNIVKEYRKEFTPNLFCFLEPRVSGTRANEIIAKMSFSNSFRVKANGFAGVIWLCWNEDTQVEILNFHPRVIHIRLGTTQNSKHFLCSIVYVSPQASVKRELWPFLNSLARLVTEHWILAGDFNYILDGSESSSGARISHMGCKWFQQFLFGNWFRDLELSCSFHLVSWGSIITFG